MSDLPFISYTMSGPEFQKALEIYNQLKEKHVVEFDPDFSCNLKPFAVFDSNEIEDSGPFLKITNSRKSFHLGFIMSAYYVYERGSGSNHFTEFQIWGIMDFSKDFGHILIRTETMLDKVHEMIHHTELNFDDDKEFSHKYYVLAEDKTKASLFLIPAFRELIKNITSPDFIIEILGNRLIIGNKKSMEFQSAAGFTDFLDQLSAIL
jgi:hypothetical protein